ncbi:hypothetical protein [Desulfovibrio sp. JC010]|uniref:hypothetical protein n=1 Tax=Desulfovibrio sp. JC010 TaxID=2593641 RepID=UPI0013D8C6F4|nr:hypothetical protein [Desulfovibrio sp. JC010]NDV27580.1 hypothetical protein [Desulfovibrio sp. JC010]
MKYVNTYFTPLNVQTESNVKKFIKYLSQKEKENEILQCYRGEEEKNLKDRITNNPQEVYQYLYEIGDKCRHLFMDDYFTNTRAHLTNIEDCSPKTLNFIYDKISYVVCNSRLQQKVRDHCPLNFIKYFKEASNKTSFTNNISEINSLPNQLIVRDYYLYFLHVAGSQGIRKESILISTSKRLRTAINFAHGWKNHSMVYGREGKPNKNSSGKIVYHYFVPRPFEFYAIAPWTITSIHNTVKNLMLPTYNPGGLFPQQQEVAIKGALFPHFILGVHKLDTDEFITNPYLENISQNDFDRISKFGFNIDQSDFEERIKESKFNGHIETDSRGNYSEHKNKKE